MNPDPDKIRTARLAAKMSIEAACDAADISKTALINIEQGHTKDPSSGRLGRLAKVYGVPVDSLYRKDETDDAA